MEMLFNRWHLIKKTERDRKRKKKKNRQKIEIEKTMKTNNDRQSVVAAPEARVKHKTTIKVNGIK